MAEEQLRITARLQNMASRGLARLRTSFQRLGDRVKAVKGGFGAFVIVANQLFDLLGRLTRGVARLATGFVRLVQRGAQLNNVTRAFVRVAGNMRASLAFLRRETLGLISNYDLMVQFNRAVTLGSAESVRQFAELAKTAITLGRALGVDAAFALQSLSLGIGRQSRLILDNLGLIVSVGEANKRYAQALGIVVKNLTENQKREAFRTAALEAARQKIAELGGITTGAADQIQRLSVSFRNVVDRIGALLDKSPAVNQFFGRLARLAEGIARKLDEDVASLKELFTTLGEVLGASLLVGIERGVAALPGLLARLGRKAVDLLGAETAETAALPTLRLTPRQALARVLRGRQQEGPPEPVTTAETRLTDAMDRLRAVFEELTQRGAEPALPPELPVPRLIRQPTEPFPLERLPKVPPPARPIRPFGFRGFEKVGQLPGMAAFEALARAGFEAEKKTSRSAELVIASFGAMAEAAIRGGEVTAQSIIGMVARIVSALPGGGLFGAILGTFGGIVGALAGGRNRVVPVSLESYSPTALQQRRDPGPRAITQFIVVGGGDVGQDPRQFFHVLARLERLDAIDRGIPRGGR